MDQHLVTLLELVRVEGIVKMLWDNVDHDELAETVHQVLQNENDNIKAELDRMTRYQLIRIADHHLDIVIFTYLNDFIDLDFSYAHLKICLFERSFSSVNVTFSVKHIICQRIKVFLEVLLVLILLLILCHHTY